MLYGGIGADGKPLNDAWVLDLEKPAWSLIYMAHSDLCPPQVPHAAAHTSTNYATVHACEIKHKPPHGHSLESAYADNTWRFIILLDMHCCLLQGAVATLHGRKLVCLSSAAGSPKLDLAMSLDIQATAVRASRHQRIQVCLTITLICTLFLVLAQRTCRRDATVKLPVLLLVPAIVCKGGCMHACIKRGCLALSSLQSLRSLRLPNSGMLSADHLSGHRCGCSFSIIVP